MICNHISFPLTNNSSLFRVSCRVGLAIDINNRFLSEVDPIDVFFISILLHDWFKTFVKASQSWLTSTKDWETRHPSEIRGTLSVRSLFDQLVHAIKVVSHGQTIIDVRHFDEFSMCWSITTEILLSS